MSKGKPWFYHFAIVKYDKTVALHMLTMIEPYLSLSHISGSIRSKLEKNLLFQVKYPTSYQHAVEFIQIVCQNVSSVQLVFTDVANFQ